MTTSAYTTAQDSGFREATQDSDFREATIEYVWWQGRQSYMSFIDDQFPNAQGKRSMLRYIYPLDEESHQTIVERLMTEGRKIRFREMENGALEFEVPGLEWDEKLRGLVW